VFSEAAAAARAVLANITVAGVVERENREAGASMYYI
jgi:Rrf2 family transcriptional regulator, cysteine metabolism repressor